MEYTNEQIHESHEQQCRVVGLTCQIEELRLSRNRFKRALKKGTVEGNWEGETELADKVKELKELKEIRAVIQQTVKSEVAQIDEEIESLTEKMRQLAHRKSLLLYCNHDACVNHEYEMWKDECKFCGKDKPKLY
jgi:hypothetical protein